MVRTSSILLSIFLIACIDTETPVQKQVRQLQFMTPPLLVVAKNENYDAMVRDKRGTIVVFNRRGIGRMICESYDVGDKIINDDVFLDQIDTVKARSNKMP